MESFGQQYSESLAVVDRREVKIKPHGATSYNPRGVKTMESTSTDSGSSCLLNTVRLQFKLKNQPPPALAGGAAADYDREMLGPPHAV